jgi:ribosomal protein S12 methylthiotransferase
MKIFIETLGCPKNTVDSENMAALLEKGGHCMADSPEEADAIIVNTCAFINDAKTESIDTILEMAQYKEDSDKLLVVSGCLTQRYSEELFGEIPEADILIGVNDYDRINEILEEHKSEDRIRYNTDAPQTYCEITERKLESGSVSAYLRIAEGCNNACSYCVIPAIRGAYRSRRMEDIVSEAEMLAGNGTKELIIIAQDVTFYGTDIYGRLALAELLRKLCKIEGIEWIRLLYCYEDSITDELIDTIKNEDKICKYIDIPLQHISDRILNNMNRHSTSESIKNTIAKLRSEIPDIHIRTTFIVGFPGETDEDYAELEDFIENTGFERLGVFAYSQEENTPAAEMPDQIDEEIKERRRDDIMAMQREISLNSNLKKVGKILRVLVEEKCEDGTYLGRTEYDAPEIDNGVIFTSDTELVPGTFTNVEITDAFDYDLTGRG